MPNGMGAEKLEKLRDRVTFITGTSKNAGKTTYLNYLLPRMRSGGDFAFMTIGVDGERRDRIFGNEKPSIETSEGDYILTCESMMNRSAGSFEILHAFPWKTALGRLLFLKTVRRGLIELAGPENNIQLARILEEIREVRGIRTVIVDGAVNRITQLAAGGESSYYYVMGITPENYDGVIEKVRTLDFLNKVDSLEESRPGDMAFRHEGALTATSLESLPRDCTDLIVEDFTKVFLSYRELKALSGTVRIIFEKTMRMEGLVIIPRNLAADRIKNKLNELGISVPLIFNPYMAGRGRYV